MKLMACAVVAISMLAGAAQAGDWRLIKADEIDSIWVDISTIRNLPYGQKKVAWMAMLLPVTSEAGADYYMVQEEFDCAAMTKTQMTFHMYEATGSTVLFSDTVQQPSMAVIPDTVGHTMLQAVCNGTNEPSSPSIKQALSVYRDVIAK